MAHFWILSRYRRSLAGRGRAQAAARSPGDGVPRGTKQRSRRQREVRGTASNAGRWQRSWRNGVPWWSGNSAGGSGSPPERRPTWDMATSQGQRECSGGTSRREARRNGVPVGRGDSAGGNGKPGGLTSHVGRDNGPEAESQPGSGKPLKP